MDNSSQDSNVEELLGYLRNIHSFEKQYRRTEASTITMIWGFFTIVAGLSDLNVSIYANYSPHPLPWIGAITSAIIAQQLISSQPLLFEKEELDIPITRNNVSRTVVMVTILAFVLTLPIGNQYPQFVMPYIGIVFGTVNLIANRNYSNKKGEKTRNVRIIAISSFFISSAVNLVLFFIDERLQIFAGAIFGLLVGLSAFYAGYRLRTNLRENLEKQESFSYSENNN